MAMELSNRQWKLAFTDRRHNPRRVTVAARDLVALHEQIAQAKSRFVFAQEAPVFSCYEAGRDGFWLHRDLVSCGIVNQVLEPSSINKKGARLDLCLVPSRQKQAELAKCKT
jgi:transposase